MNAENSNNAKLLNPNQRGHLTTTLGVMEEMLCEIEQTLTVGCCTGVLYLPAQVKEEVLRRISLVRNRVEITKGEFALEKSGKDASRVFKGKLVYSRGILEEAKARHQRGYGAVAEGLAEALDPHIDAIITLVDDMRDLVMGKAKE
jgi:hypothetical protein